MRNFDLRAEAEMRLRSEQFAAELAEKRREQLAAAGDDEAAQAPVPAEAATAAATASDADDASTG
ncbi:hypothetical protein ACWD6P_26530 [Streptomyces sp. NPDC002446]